MGQKDSKVILQDSSASILFPFSFKDTHYFQKVSNLYNDTSNEGVVDFVGMFPSYGIAYVSDTTGHGYHISEKQKEKKNSLCKLWKTFDENIIPQLYEKAKCGINWIDLKNLLFETIKILNSKFENVGIAATFSFVWLLKTSNNEIRIALIQIGDSGIVLLKLKDQNLQIQALSSYQDPSVNQTELCSVIASNVPIELQSLNSECCWILGITDGVFDFLGSSFRDSYSSQLETIRSIFLSELTKSKNESTLLLQNYVTALENVVQQNAIDWKVQKHNLDDLAFFIFQIPSI